MNRSKEYLAIVVASFLITAVFCYSAKASNTIGTIDSINKYVWASKIGWINFGPINGNVTITDSALTGYVWNQNYGWINLSPINGGVLNNGNGVLSGHAWGEKLGWISFSGVTINSTGKFTGTATGSIAGTVNFDCTNTNCNVSTDWRPRTSRPACNNATDDDGDGLIDYPADAGCSSLTDTDETNASVGSTLNLGGGSSIHYPTNNTASTTTITTTTQEDKAADDKVVTKPTLSNDTSQNSNNKTIIQKIGDSIKKIASKIDLVIPDFLKPWRKEKEQKLEDVRQFVSQATPLVMKGSWKLLPSESIRQYVFAPLPDELKALAKSFPSIGSLFDSVGIKSMQDLRKLSGVQISIPSLSKAVGLVASPLKNTSVVSGQSLAVETLSTDLKTKIPTNFVFANAQNQLVDLGTIMSLSSNGRPVQKLRTISGKKIHLSVKPEYQAKKVKGYLTFVSPSKQVVNSRDFLPAFLQKTGLIEYASAADSVLSSLEQKLVLEQFEYQDPDGDGIYTAEVYLSVPRGEYEILTAIEYTDSQYGTKLVRLSTVVDPEGYVYEKVNGNELRISNALVSLYWLDPQSKKYVLWPADKYQQKNGQVTDERGSYSFLVPAGSYYLQVQAAGYEDYQSALFKVDDGNGVHINIELKSQSWYLKALDWKTWVIILLSAILLYMIENEIRTKKTIINDIKKYEA